MSEYTLREGAHSGTGMKIAVYLLEPRDIDMGVALCGGNTRVAKHFLYLTQIGTSGEKMGGKAMPHRMRTYRVGQPEAMRVFFKEFPNTLAL
tara:strand:+ start:896 stop:1171 length:276 start_codon:yes stop_codon:yes gene_type:complete